MSKTIVISDLHYRHRQMERVLAWEKDYDKAIFLGDYFDQWGDDAAQAKEAAEWLKEAMQDPRHVFLIGNHDWQYIWPENPWPRCGYDTRKAMAIWSVLDKNDFKKLLPCHVDQGILFSHAGFDAYLPQQLASAGFQAPINLTVEGICEFINQLWPEVCQRYERGSLHPLMDSGQCRGGTQKVGGIIWRDFGYITPIPGIGQIVGHSIMDNGPLFRIINKNDAPMWRHASKKILTRWLENGWVLGMDCNSKWYTVIENKKITVKRVEWRRKFRPDGTWDAGFTISPTAESYTIQIKDNSKKCKNI